MKRKILLRLIEHFPEGFDVILNLFGILTLAMSMAETSSYTGLKTRIIPVCAAKIGAPVIYREGCQSIFKNPTGWQYYYAFGCDNGRRSLVASKFFSSLAYPELRLEIGQATVRHERNHVLPTSPHSRRIILVPHSTHHGTLPRKLKVKIRAVALASISLKAGNPLAA